MIQMILRWISRIYCFMGFEWFRINYNSKIVYIECIKLFWHFGFFVEEPTRIQFTLPFFLQLVFKRQLIFGCSLFNAVSIRAFLIYSWIINLFNLIIWWHIELGIFSFVICHKSFDWRSFVYGTFFNHLKQFVIEGWCRNFCNWYRECHHLCICVQINLRRSTDRHPAIHLF
jgi:hypothetical protein